MDASPSLPDHKRKSEHTRLDSSEKRKEVVEVQLCCWVGLFPTVPALICVSK
jgi:hypothetical protein